MKKQKRTEPVKINKLGIVLLAVGAHIVGYAPAVSLIQHPIVLAYIIVWVLLISIIGIRKFTSHATEAPSLAEFLLGGLESVLMPAFVGLVWMGLYGIVLGVSVLVQLLIDLFGGQLIFNASLIALYPTVILGGIVAMIASKYQVDDMTKKLYPDIAGVRSEYFKFFTTDRSKMIWSASASIIVLLILVVLLTFHILNQYLIYILMQFTFFIVGNLFVSETKTEKTEKKKRVDIVGRIKMLLETDGYITEINPRTGDASIDPLLINLDIFAQRDNHNLLLDIRSKMDANKIIDWKSASTLIQSAYLLSAGKNIEPKDMDARLLLIDVKPDPSLKKISEQENIPVLYFSGRQIDEIFELSDTEEQKLAIRSLLNLPSEGKSLGYSSKK